MKPVVIYTILFNGPMSVATSYVQPIVNLKPVNTMTKEIPYTAIAGLTGNGNNDPACQKGASTLRFPIYLQQYNVTSFRQLYDAFSDMVAEQPHFNNSFFLVEGYGTQAVASVPANSTAYAHREEKLLL
jgi:hypothetical protein